MYSPSLKPDNKTPLYVGYFDRITITDPELVETYSEIITRGKGDTDYLSFKATEIRLLRTIDKVFTADIDFKLDDLGNIKWTSKNQPSFDLTRDEGEAYSVCYLRSPVYRVVGLYEENRFVMSGIQNKFKLQKRLVQESKIKKDFLITKKDLIGQNMGVEQG